MSVQINRYRCSYFSPSREIRQCNPLSPYLFLIYPEGFSHIIKSFDLQGIEAARHSPSVSHLLFIDISILFSKSSKMEARFIRELLDKYLRISSLIFSPNTSTLCRQRIASIIDIQRIYVYNKFLELPSSILRSKREAFDYIKERISVKCVGWKKKYCQKVVRRSLSKLLPRQCLSTLCYVLDFQSPFVTRSIGQYPIFGEDKKLMRRSFIGLLGQRCAKQRNWVA